MQAGDGCLAEVGVDLETTELDLPLRAGGCVECAGDLEFGGFHPVGGGVVDPVPGFFDGSAFGVGPAVGGAVLSKPGVLGGGEGPEPDPGVDVDRQAQAVVGPSWLRGYGEAGFLVPGFAVPGLVAAIGVGVALAWGVVVAGQ